TISRAVCLTNSPDSRSPLKEGWTSPSAIAVREFPLLVVNGEFSKPLRKRRGFWLTPRCRFLLVSANLPGTREAAARGSIVRISASGHARRKRSESMAPSDRSCNLARRLIRAVVLPTILVLFVLDCSGAFAQGSRTIIRGGPDGAQEVLLLTA